MTADEIMKIIDIIPNLIIYFLPGFLFFRIIQYQISYKYTEKKSEYICYIVISSIFIKLGEYLSIKVNGEVDIYSNEFCFGLIIFSIFFGYLVGLFLNSEVSRSLLNTMKIYRTNGPNIFAEIKDVEFGTQVCVYLNSVPIVYNGALRQIEYADSYDETFILLSNYITYHYTKDCNVCEEVFQEKKEDHKWVALRVKDISRIEIYYSKNSKKIK